MNNTSVTIPMTERLAQFDDCLTAAANAYIARYPELLGWDLAPRWEDDQRQAITLLVPTWALDDGEVS